MTYVDPDLRALFALAREHNAVFIWDGIADPAGLSDRDLPELYSVDMDRLTAAVGEEEAGRFQPLLGGRVVRLPVLDRNFWAPTGHYAGYKGE
jgi:hypothetical protein